MAPPYGFVQATARPARWTQALILAIFLTVLLFNNTSFDLTFKKHPSKEEQVYRESVLEQCRYLNTPPGPPPKFHERSQSDRFVAGTKAVLITNAKIWTAGHNGTEIVHGGILLDQGLIKAVGKISHRALKDVDYVTYDAAGAWVTPGLIDLHSHICVDSIP